LGAALRGQADTVLHELLVHGAVTPELLLAKGGALGWIFWRLWVSLDA